MQDIAAATQRERQSTGVVLLGWQRCNTLASRDTTPAVFEHLPVFLRRFLLLLLLLLLLSVVLPFPRSAVSSRPSRARAADNVIYAGRVINVLGDRRFKKAIGNRRQRRATVSPPSAGCRMTNYRARDRCPALFSPPFCPALLLAPKSIAA